MINDALPTDFHAPTIVFVFDDRYEAEKAVDDLEQAGFRHSDIGFAIHGADVAPGGMITDAVGAKDAQGAAVGALGGGVLGGVLGAAASLLIPGVGPVVAGGLLTMVFGGAAAGTAIGGIFGAMTGLGISEDQARHLDAEFHSGKAIVAVRVGGRATEAVKILQQHGGYDPRARSQPPVSSTETAIRPAQ
jgi:hypothetical protein